MEPLRLEEGGLALTYNLKIGNGVEVVLGKHLGKKHLLDSPEGEVLILEEDLWEVPGVSCKISDSSSGLGVVGPFIPSKNLMPLGKPTPSKHTPIYWKEFKPVSFLVA